MPTLPQMKARMIDGHYIVLAQLAKGVLPELNRGTAKAFNTLVRWQAVTAEVKMQRLLAAELTETGRALLTHWLEQHPALAR